MPIPQDKKLTVINRVEPGCLGPNGDNLVKDFCVFAQKEFADQELEYIDWQVIPRVDKTLSELQYRVNNKDLTRDQAEKYLSLFDERIEEFESLLGDMLTHLIEDFAGR